MASGSSPGILYGLPKVHKPDIPTRPILSACGTANYNIAKFLVPKLAYLTENEYTVKNSYIFAQNMQTYNNSSEYYMCSFDITSLFTNIPLDETLEICLDELFKDNVNNVDNLTRTDFKTLLQLSVKDSYFIFNDKLYQQTDGLAMGSPLAPTLANLFLCYFEKLWLAECPVEIKPKLYQRYVDDTFLLFDNEDQSKQFLTYLNSKHRNIKFTAEGEENNRLAFLDVLITKENANFLTSVYRKKTFTGLSSNFFSCTPFLYKINVIKTLVYRAYHLCSSYVIFNNEINFLKKFFVDNGYPLGLFYKYVNQYVSSRYETKTVYQLAEKQKKFICLPYFGYISMKIRSDLEDLLKRYYPHVDIRLVFKNSFSIGTFFRHKDKIPEALCSTIVYKYTCSECNSEYVGSTSRHFKMRVAEHMGLSFRTNRPLSKPSKSSPREHHEHTGHSFSRSDFRILDRCRNVSSLRILESLHIMKTKPRLNDYSAAATLNISI